jgi:hypothetical protein
MSSMIRTTAGLTALAFIAALSLSACDQQGPAEKLGEKIDNGAEQLGEAVEDAAK